jgi:hypothetical protein
VWTPVQPLSPSQVSWSDYLADILPITMLDIWTYSLTSQVWSLRRSTWYPRTLHHTWDSIASPKGLRILFARIHRSHHSWLSPPAHTIFHHYPHLLIASAATWRSEWMKHIRTAVGLALLYIPFIILPF